MGFYSGKEAECGVPLFAVRTLKTKALYSKSVDLRLSRLLCIPTANM